MRIEVCLKGEKLTYYETSKEKRAEMALLISK